MVGLLLGVFLRLSVLWATLVLNGSVGRRVSHEVSLYFLTVWFDHLFPFKCAYVSLYVSPDTDSMLCPPWACFTLFFV